jgi:hypothetical protein
MLFRYSSSKEFEENASSICPVSQLFDRSNSFKDGKDKHHKGIVSFSKLSLNAETSNFVG